MHTVRATCAQRGTLTTARLGSFKVIHSGAQGVIGREPVITEQEHQ